jgi:hypothetical protein
VVDVPDGADVHVRLGPLELGLAHCFSSLRSSPPAVGPGRFLVAPFF